MGVNAYSIYTWDEFKAKFIGEQVENTNFTQSTPTMEETKQFIKDNKLKYTVNWYDYLKFSPVRQNNPQNCPNPYWAIATA